MPTTTKRFFYVLMALALGACTSGGRDFNSPLAPPDGRPLPKEGKALYGQWRAGVDGSQAKYSSLYVGHIKLKDQHYRNDRLLMFFSDPKDRHGWAFAPTHTTTIKDRTYLNLNFLRPNHSGDFNSTSKRWRLMLFSMAKDEQHLMLRNLRRVRRSDMHEAEIYDFDLDNQGAAAAEYIRRRGPDALIESDGKWIFARVEGP